MTTIMTVTPAAPYCPEQDCGAYGRAVARIKGKQMFAPSINVDLEKLQKASEEPLKGKRVASRGRPAARKPKPQPEKDE